MTKLSILILSIFCSSGIIAQSGDYLKMYQKKSFEICTVVEDSSSLMKEIQLLKCLNPDSISINRAIYHCDLGSLYYKAAIRLNDSSLFRSALSEFENSLQHDSLHLSSIWPLAILHNYYGNCLSTKKYLNLYMSIAPKKQWDKPSIKGMQKKCGK